MNKRNYIFESCVTINGEFLIFQDDVFSIKEQKSIGNIWSSIDLFKKIFKSVNIKNNDYKIIRESILRLPLLENNGNLYGLRDILLEFDFLQDTWLGQQFTDTKKGIADFATKSYDGLKKFGLAISQGQWSEILNLLGKGAVFILRSLKSALFSTGGMIVDAMLFGMGIGKLAQFVPWAMVFGLDIYQWISNDYEEETTIFTKVLDISFDIIGMLSSGFLAQEMKVLFEPLKRFGKNEKLIANEITKNKKMSGFISTILNGLNKVPGFFTRVINLIIPKFPKIGVFLKSISGKISSVLNTIKNVFEKIIGVKGTEAIGGGIKSGVKTGGILYGFHKGLEKISGVSNDVTIDDLNLNDIQKNNMNILKDVLKNENL
jgi:hypothetical protein